MLCYEFVTEILYRVLSPGALSPVGDVIAPGNESPFKHIQALSVFEPGCRLRSAVLDLRFEGIQAFQKRSLGLSNHL